MFYLNLYKHKKNKAVCRIQIPNLGVKRKWEDFKNQGTKNMFKFASFYTRFKATVLFEASESDLKLGQHLDKHIRNNL